MNIHSMPPEDLLQPEAHESQKPNPQLDTPVSDSNPEKPIKKANKGLILVILMAFVVTSAVIGYILFLQLTGTKNLITAQNFAALIKLSTPKPSPYPGRSPLPTFTPDPNSIKTGKTYTNTQYGYTISYPETWILEVLEDDLVEKPYEYLWIKSPSGYTLMFGVKDKDDSNEFFRPLQPLVGDFIEVEPTKIGEFTVPTFHFGSNNIVYDVCIASKCTRFGYLINDRHWVFADFWSQDTDNFQDITKTIEYEQAKQILSTFKFIEKVDTSNWQTHTDETYKYSFQYPQEYETRDLLSSKPNNKNTLIYLIIGPKTMDNNAFSEIVEISKNSMAEAMALYKLGFQKNESFEFVVENQISINGIEGREVVHKYSHNGSTSFQKAWFFQLGEITYKFIGSDYEHKTIEQIAKTIKFTN